MPAPAPTELASAMTPAAVVQAAVQVFAVRGFTVTNADASGGVVIARKAIPTGHADIAKDLLACRWGPDAVGWRMTSGVATLTVTARPNGAGSAVTIIGTTDAGLPGECVSSGKTEAAIASAVATK